MLPPQIEKGHFSMKHGSSRLAQNSNSYIIRTRRAPSHVNVVNLVRSGTKQPYWFAAVPRIRLAIFISLERDGFMRDSKRNRAFFVPGETVHLE